MDWPVTEGYVIATAEALALTLRRRWKEGSFEVEMLCDLNTISSAWAASQGRVV
jgi:hypothetical protein